jgi:D-alanine-D-alanine ligase-like ATP-grasp enzyme
VKPNQSGSSLGVSKVNSLEDFENNGIIINWELLEFNIRVSASSVVSINFITIETKIWKNVLRILYSKIKFLHL